MKINSRDIFIIISSAFVALYILAFILDIVYPQYLGVDKLTSLLAFRNGSGIIPVPPSLNHGWRNYMGTTYYGISIFPALLGSLKFDFTMMFASLAISALSGIIIGASAAFAGSFYRKFILYITKIFTSVPYILVMLLILYIARPSETGIIIAISIGWLPFYILRSVEIFTPVSRRGSFHGYRKAMLRFIPYLITDIGAISGVVTIITYFGFYFHNPFIVDIGNVMYLNGNIDTFLFSGVWWIIIFPLAFITVFIGFTALLSYEIRGVMENAVP
jgi:ABC-type dipeptide/oligopeptide/nickel transport system permease subunit